MWTGNKQASLLYYLTKYINRPNISIGCFTQNLKSTYSFRYPIEFSLNRTHIVTKKTNHKNEQKNWMNSVSSIWPKYSRAHKE